MKKIFASILITTLLLTGCGAEKQPYADTIEKFVVGSKTGQDIPEKYHEFAGAMMEQAWRDCEEDGENVDKFQYAWDYQDTKDNLLGLGHISLEIIPDGGSKRNYSYLFTE